MARTPFDPSCGFDIAATTIRDSETLDRISEWGYRLVRHESGTLFLHEAFYDADGMLLGLAIPPTRLCGDTLEKVREELRWMNEGVGEPILDAAELGSFEGTFHRYGWKGDNGAQMPGGPFFDN
ncbi:MAG: hypothetical protein R3181_02470 [Rubricoccaceae bacterium]|nr:hypothetical protein [Rubricoccaceae bacterium]